MKQTKENILSHLEALVRTVMDDKAAKQSFLDLAGDRTFTAPQLRVLFRSASDTAKSDLNGTYAGLWSMFRDNLIKKTMGTHNLPDQHVRENLMDLVIFARWNKENFTKVMDIRDIGNVPEYPAAMEEIRNFPTLLHYMADKVSPVLESYLRGSLQIDAADFGAILDDRENALIADGVRGVEILMPIPPEKWPRPRKGQDRSPP